MKTLNVLVGKKLHEHSLNIYDAFPFVALRTRLWNLLPAHQTINNKKRDAVPTVGILEQPKVKDRIIHAWANLASQFREQFFSEIRVALLGKVKLDVRTGRIRATRDSWK